MSLQLYIVSQSIPKEYRHRKVVSLDCDTIYACDILDDVRRMSPDRGGCFYFVDSGIEPIFSYIHTESRYAARPWPRQGSLVLCQ